MIPPDAHDSRRIAHIVDTALRSLPTQHAPLSEARSSLSAKAFLSEQGLIKDDADMQEKRKTTRSRDKGDSVVFPLPRSPDDPGPGMIQDDNDARDRAKNNDI